MQEVVTILNNRVNGLGVSGRHRQSPGQEVVVSVPGVKNARTVLKAVGQTAQLLFRPVLCARRREPKLKAVAPGKLPACGAQYL
jgi:preprotein translocase subunit SecD